MLSKEFRIFAVAQTAKKWHYDHGEWWHVAATCMVGRPNEADIANAKKQYQELTRANLPRDIWINIYEHDGEYAYSEPFLSKEEALYEDTMNVFAWAVHYQLVKV